MIKSMNMHRKKIFDKILLKRMKRKYNVRSTGIALLMLLIAQTVTAQGDDILQHFNAYREHNLQEKLFVHTDKPMYMAGEICWFKIYYVDGLFHKPMEVSKLAYVEVLDNANKPVLQAKIALKEGAGNGSLQLPFSLASGNYKLRAYTNWMKNFGPEYFFEKKLAVVNTRMGLAVNVTQPLPAAIVQFFPEGGNMVNGISGRIAFHIVNAYGKGVGGNGVIVNEKGDTAASFTAQQFGMGSFLLTPQAGHSYRGMLQLAGGQRVVQDLPAAAAEGYAMQLTTTGNGQLKIAVRSAAAGGGAVYLFAHTRGAVKSVQKNTIQNGSTEFLIDKSKLGDGISQLTVFNAERQPVCERLYFKYPSQQLQTTLTADADSYETRKKINIHISNAGQQAAADMSVAVYRIDSLQNLDETTISSYIWLSADLNGTVESPGFYFDGPAEGKEAAMDNLMLTQGWRRFKWQEVLSGRQPAFTFVPEYGGHIITGKVIRTANGSNAKDVAAYLAVPGTHTQFRNAVSDNEGNIKFEMNNFYNNGEIVVQTDNMEDTVYQVEIQSPFVEQYTAPLKEPVSVTAALAPSLAQYSTSVHVQNEYNGDKLKQFNFPDVDTTNFYHHPDVSYLLDNYVRFTTLEEVLREYVMPVNVRKRNGRFHLPVFDELSKQFFLNDPLLLLDGIPVFNIDKFMQYDPLKIRKLEVVSRRYFLGNMFFEGIVNFVTYKGNLEGYELDPRATVIDYPGLQVQREFYAPVYATAEQQNSHLPDFRNLLYWSPSVKTTAWGKTDLSFYSSDISGRYAVVLQGLTEDGKTGGTTLLFDVKEPPAITRQ